MASKKKTRRTFIKTAGGALAAVGAGSSCARLGFKKGGGGDASASGATSMEMPKRVLGRTNLSVSFLGFAVLHTKNQALYRRAVDLGVNFFHSVVDSNTRKLLAPDEFNFDAFAALRPLRDRLVISHMTVRGATSAGMLKELDNFLQKSGFGHLDLWFVCCPSPEAVNEFGKAMAVARKAGKARWGAMSSHSYDKHMSRLTGPDSPIDVVMMAYNHTSPTDHTKRLAELSAAGLGFVTMKHLAGRFYEKTEKDAATLIRWLAADSRIHSIPVGMQTIEEVEQNVAALQEPFSDEDRKALKRQLAYTSPRFCRMCGACEGRCPRGLAISDLVRVAMYAEGYRNPGLARVQFDSIPVAQRRISCQDCRQCFVRCPNGVAIRDRVLRVQRLWA